MKCYLCSQELKDEPTRMVLVKIPPDQLVLMKAGKPYSGIAHKAHRHCPRPMTLRCGCCGFAQIYESLENAYNDGWDEPDHLPSWPVSCPLCPGVATMGLIDHSAAHERWERQGRPKSFEASVTMGDVPA